jgi:3-deoxy-D-manno-octulosonic-acid transferase
MNSYHFLLSILVPILRLAAPFHKKISAWFNGRKDWNIQLKNAQFNENEFNVWFHCASLGEFEQGKTLMEEIKHLCPNTKILVTFFSPSGFEARKNDPIAHHVGYLPIDTAENASLFMELAKPKLIVFVKSEIWPNFILAMKRKRVPSILISARFHEGQTLFKRNGKLFLNSLKKFDFIFVQNKSSQKLLRKHGIEAILSGDTRYDRVAQLKLQPKTFPFIETFVDKKPCLVVGSCWEQDIEALLPFMNNQNEQIKIILAPHDIGEKMIQHIISRLKVNFVRYSELANFGEQKLLTVKILIIDNIGMLSSAYQYGHVAYVGGAFKQGLHNILEPAVFELPVIFGPHIDGFPEAKEMLNEGGAFSIKDAVTASLMLKQLFDDPSSHASSSNANKNFIEIRVGATQKIMNTVRMLVASKVETTH